MGHEPCPKPSRTGSGPVPLHCLSTTCRTSAYSNHIVADEPNAKNVMARVRSVIGIYPRYSLARTTHTRRSHCITSLRIHGESVDTGRRRMGTLADRDVASRLALASQDTRYSHHSLDDRGYLTAIPRGSPAHRLGTSYLSI